MKITNAIALASPITWTILAIVAAIVALIAIITLLVKNWDKVKDFGIKAWEGIKDAWNNASTWFNEKIIQPIANFFTGLWEGIKTGAENIWNAVTTTFNKVKDAIMTPINKAKEGVKAAIEKIKSFFKFKFELPKIPTPHFGIKPTGWKIGDLLQGSIPKLNIDWYAKAMEDGMILNDATIFGMNPSGQFMGGGEAGSEVIVGTHSLANMVNAAVKAETSALSNRFDDLMSMLAKFFPEILSANKVVVLDSGVLVGQLAPAMNTKFNDMSRANERGR